jgi:wyosine [tRNA(Phe)-imidazoG37] synthetase (radical SAM superfamily)
MIPFGPIPSRRFGLSLGINHLPATKVCSYACQYCQVGPTRQFQTERQAFYPPEEVARQVSERLEALQRCGERVDVLSFVPDGEPTVDLGLGRAIELLRPLGLPIAVITCSALVDRADVRRELALADIVSVKVDSVREASWRRVNGPARPLRLQPILAGLRAFAREFRGRLLTETMLVAGENDSPEELEATARFVAALEPAVAYVSIPTRPPSSKSVRAPDDATVALAYELFSRRLRSVECLTGFSDAGFGCTGDAGRDLLDILAVHPMREREVEAFLSKAGAAVDVLEALVREGRVQAVQHGCRRFYVRSRSAPVAGAARA